MKGVSKADSGKGVSFQEAPKTIGLPSKSKMRKGLEKVAHFALRLGTWTASMAVFCALGVITSTALSATALILPVSILAVGVLLTVAGGALIYRDRREKEDEKLAAAFITSIYVLAPISFISGLIYSQLNY